MDNIEYDTKKIISEQFGLETDKIQNEMSISKSLGADSIDLIELIMSIEEYFHIEIKDEQIKKISKVEDIVNCIIENKTNK